MSFEELGKLISEVNKRYLDNDTKEYWNNLNEGLKRMNNKLRKILQNKDR